MKTHRYFTRQPKPPVGPGFDFNAIGGPGGFIRYDKRICAETMDIKGIGLCRWHRLNCCPVWRSGDQSNGIRLNGFDNPYAVIVERGALNQWTGSSYMALLAVIHKSAAGGWLLGGEHFTTLLRAVRKVYARADVRAIFEAIL